MNTNDCYEPVNPKDELPKEKGFYYVDYEKETPNQIDLKQTIYFDGEHFRDDFDCETTPLFWLKKTTINAVGGEDIIHATLNRLGYGFLGRKKFIDEVMQSLQIKESLKPDERSVSNNSEKNAVGGMKQEIRGVVAPEFCPKCNPSGWGSYRFQLLPEIQICCACGYEYKNNIEGLEESSVSNNSEIPPKQETNDDWKGKDFEAAG